MKKITVSIFVFYTIIAAFGCRKNQKEVLFTMTYPELQFEIPPGISGSQALVFSFPSVKTNIDNFLSQNNTTLDEIGSIQPIRARIESTNGRSLYFIQKAEIRICSIDSLQCEPLFDQAFQVDGLNGSASTFFDLIPGIKERTDLLTSDRFKMEIILQQNIGDVTPYSVNCKASVSFEALK